MSKLSYFGRFGNRASINKYNGRLCKKHHVVFRNWGHTLTGAEDEAIYDAALAQGIQLRIACKYGGCITCAAKMIWGEVPQRNATALNRRQSKAGYILLCVSHPTADCVLDVGVEAHDQLYQNPFAVASERPVALCQRG